MAFFLKKHSIVPLVFAFCLLVAAMAPRLSQPRVPVTTGFSRNAVFDGTVLDQAVTVIPRRFTMERLATKARSGSDGSSS